MSATPLPLSPMALEPVLLLAFTGFEALAEEIDGHALPAGGGDDILLGPVISRDGDLVLSGIPDRETLDDVINGLTAARVDDLKTGRRALFGQRCASTVKDDDDTITSEVTKLRKTLHQFGIGAAGNTTLEIKEVIPPVDHIVPINQ
jgi:hypothetical protein